MFTPTTHGGTMAKHRTHPDSAAREKVLTAGVHALAVILRRAGHSEATIQRTYGPAAARPVRGTR